MFVQFKLWQYKRREIKMEIIQIVLSELKHLKSLADGLKNVLKKI